MPVLVCQTGVNSKKKCTISPKKNIPQQRQNKSRYWSASLTVEAALIVPMFFFVVFLLWQIFLLLMFQLKVCEQVTETILDYSHLGYVERKEEQQEVDISWIYETLLWTTIPEHENAVGRWVNCQTEEDGTILVKISYHFLCEAVFFPTISLPVTQTFRFYPYLGEQDKDLLKEEVEAEEDIVYMTEHGTVYHVSKACVYLNVMLKSIPVSSLTEERNSYGQLYTECSKCIDEIRTEQVYISLGGNKYHWSLQCSAVKRTVIEKAKEDVDGIQVCHKCGKHNKEKP